MAVSLDYHGGQTRVTLADSLGNGDGGLVRPRKLRKAMNRLRKALGLADEVRIDVVAFTPADGLMVVPVGSPAAEGMVPPEEVLGRWPLSPAALEGRSHFSRPAAPPAPIMRTYGDLATFIRDFVGSPQSLLNGTRPTIKDLINQLNSCEFGDVSAAIHKIGPALSMKVDWWLEDVLEASPAMAIPAEAKP